MNKFLFMFVFLQGFSVLCFCAFLRDPFNLCSKNQEVDIELRENIELVGVINIGSDFGAILRNGSMQEVVFLSDHIWGYAVKEITLDHVLLVQADKTIKLQIG
jgi:hypothetical protein